jgi:hypothetical protein
VRFSSEMRPQSTGGVADEFREHLPRQVTL